MRHLHLQSKRGKRTATLRPDIKDMNHKEDFKNGTFVNLKRKYFSKWEQLDQSDSMICSAYEVWPIRLFVLVSLWTFPVTQALLLHDPYLSIWMWRRTNTCALARQTASNATKENQGQNANNQQGDSHLNNKQFLKILYHMISLFSKELYFWQNKKNNLLPEDELSMPACTAPVTRTISDQQQCNGKRWIRMGERLLHK